MAGDRAMFLADWCEALFVHFQVPSQELAKVVPFPLDTLDGQAFVSLVAFTQRNLRPAMGGRIWALLSTPLAEHAFLNLRAYVRVNDEPAIYFVSEWIPNRLAVLIGPRLYGLPYRLGALKYEHERAGQLKGRVMAPTGQFAYRATVHESAAFDAASPGSLDHFLLERYVAYTHRRGVSRRFRVSHDPWPQARATMELLDTSLLQSVSPAFADAEMIGANYSTGVCDVGISPPQKIEKTISVHG